MNPLAVKSAQQECTIHSSMKHVNVVELYNYTETEKDYVMYMEYCDKGTYLAHKIHEVSITMTWH